MPARAYYAVGLTIEATAFGALFVSQAFWIVMVMIGVIVLLFGRQIARLTSERAARPYLALSETEIKYATYGPFRKTSVSDLIDSMRNEPTFYSGGSVGDMPAMTLYGQAAMGASAHAEQPPVSTEEVDTTPCFARVKATNNPPEGMLGAPAEKVTAEVAFYDSGGALLLGGPMQGRWSASEQAHERSRVGMSLEHLETEIPANGLPRPIDIAMKYRRDADCFGYNDDNSSAFKDGRLERHRLVGSEFKVVVTITDGEGRKVSRDFVLTNLGADKDLRLEPA